MEVYRLSREKFANTLSGKGSAIKGARWNSVGVEIIYTAANRSLAMAEIAVHFTLATLPVDYVMITIFIPDKYIISKNCCKRFTAELEHISLSFKHTGYWRPVYC